MNFKKLFLLFVIISSSISAFDVSKYVVPCGGFGTRMLPLSFSMPKEMIPLMSKPALQEAVEEGLRGGLSQFYIITKRQKSCIEDHFDPSPEIEEALKASGKLDRIASIKAIHDQAKFIYLRQPEMGGTGHAVLQAKPFISDDYFAVGWPDVFLLGEPTLFKSMINVCKQYSASVIAVQEIPMSEVGHYGVVVVGNEIAPNVFEVTDLVEKPKPEESPSNLVNVGRFVLSKKVFDSLEVIPRASNGELQLPDAIIDMMKKGEKLYAYKTPAKLYDIGRPVPWLEGTIRYGLAQKEFANEVKEVLKSIVKDFDLKGE